MRPGDLPRAVVGRVTLTVLDQGLFAGSNFVLNVLLARWLAPPEYGAFTLVSFVVLLLIGVIHTGLFSEPMLVYGSGVFRKRRVAYVRLLIRGHVVFSLGTAVIVAAVGWVCAATGLPVLSSAFYGLAVAQGFILLMWLLRRACYIFLKPDVAVAGGAAYAALITGGLVGLGLSDASSALTGVLLMGAASFGAATIVVIRLRIFTTDPAAVVSPREAWAVHRGYSGWATATGALEWVQGLFPFLVLPLWYGLASTGALRALFNLVMPVMHTYGAVSLLLLPMYVRAREAGRVREVAVRSIGLVVTGTVVYGLLVGVGGERVLDLVYRGQYSQYATLLWLFALYPVVGGAASTLATLRRSQERPRAVFRARTGAAVFMALIGMVLIRAYGLLGAIVGAGLASLVEVFLLIRSSSADRTRGFSSVVTSSREDHR